MLEIPLKKVQELEGDARKVMIHMIRILSKDFCNESHLGLEGTEEALTELINKGLAKIFWDEEEDKFWITHYNFETESYVNKNKE